MGTNPLSCGAQCSKITLITLNIIFLLCGIAMLVIGLIVRFGSGTLKEDIKDMFDFEVSGINFYDLLMALAIIFIIAGAIVIVFSVLGFIGAACEMKACLIFYSSLLIIILILELVGVILFFVMRSDFEDTVKKGLKENIVEANQGQDSFQKAAEYMMNEFECCHVDNTRLSDAGTTLNTCALGANAHGKDCYTALKDKVEEYQVPLVVIGIVVMVVELLCIVMGCWLCRAYRKGADIY